MYPSWVVGSWVSLAVITASCFFVLSLELLLGITICETRKDREKFLKFYALVALGGTLFSYAPFLFFWLFWAFVRVAGWAQENLFLALVSCCFSFLGAAAFLLSQFRGRLVRFVKTLS